jgi:hypothetical protein
MSGLELRAVACAEFSAGGAFEASLEVSLGGSSANLKAAASRCTPRFACVSLGWWVRCGHSSNLWDDPGNFLVAIFVP